MRQRKMIAESRDIGPLDIRADLVPSTTDDEARTVEVCFTTGAKVERLDWTTGKRFLESLSMNPEHVRMGRINGGAPVLDAHSAWSINDQIGVVVPGSVKFAGKEARATLQFSAREAVEPIWQDVKAGIIRNVSVGYRVHKFEESEAKGRMPVRLATDWEPYEISMVPMGADPRAHVRGETSVETNPCVFERIAREEKPMDELTPEVTREAPAPNPEPNPPVDLNAVRAEAAKGERDRAAGIRRAVRAARLDDKVADELIQAGTSIEAARAAVLEKLEERSAEPGIDSAVSTRAVFGEDEGEKWNRGVEAWLYHKAGVASVVRGAVEKKHEGFANVSLDPAEFRGLTLVDLCRASLERRGISTRGMDKMTLVGRAMILRDSGVLGAQTTSDFTVALENALHKTLLAAFVTTPSTWRRFAKVGSVTDFRAHSRHLAGFIGTLDKVLEGGEFKNKALPDTTKESIQAETRGNIIALSRQAIVNDDMSVFSGIAMQAGRAAELSVEVDLYTLLKLNAGLGPTMGDGKTLFHADHGNINSSSSALGVAGLDADRVILATQTDASGNEILDLRPDVLVVPIGLGGTARVTNDAVYDPDTANKLQLPNRVRGLFRDIVDTPRLTGNRRYIFADPNALPVFEVVFLEGNQEPFLEMKDGWRIDGVEWKIRHDYGVGAVNYRGAVTNAGG